MDKPKNLSIKDFLIRKMSVKLLHSEELIDKIVSHQFSSAHEAMKGNNNSVELSGFGKFLFNKTRALKKLDNSYYIEKCLIETSLNPDIPEHKRITAGIKLASIKEYISTLKPKLTNVSIKAD